jgi:hypothetical protein
MRDAKRPGPIPLMITVITHEMDAWKVELAATSGTSCDVENSRVIGIFELFNLMLFRCSFQPVGVDQLLVLDKIRH